MSDMDPRLYNVFMLNSAEHEHILLLNVKMPTNVLTFISRINDWSWKFKYFKAILLFEAMSI